MGLEGYDDPSIVSIGAGIEIASQALHLGNVWVAGIAGTRHFGAKQLVCFGC